MLCSKIKQTILIRSKLNRTALYRYIVLSNSMLKRCFSRGWFITKYEYTGIENNMSPLRYILKDFSVVRLWTTWTRSHLVYNVVRKCRKDRSVREVFHCFRQTFFRPRRTLLLSATAAFKRNDDDEDTKFGCDRNITDEEIEDLLTELDGIEELSRRTLFCFGCGRRLVIDKKVPTVLYCSCDDTKSLSQSSDGWEPYMEAEDVIIWRKEYKPGQGLYAYKVYGRYKEVRAQDFAAVQVDGAYRRVWDSAVASLCVVERNANGVQDQAVLHWEVLWPRLFANRDYVYIRRHKEYEVRTTSQPHKDTLFESRLGEDPASVTSQDRPNVHSNAKRKSLEVYSLRRDEATIKDNKVYVIVSKSCEHPRVPVTKNAIRVSEYWSHMVVKTLDGADQVGMEFVLTYYDEPAVGGLPYGVAMWATTRAATAFLDRMRTAALNYHQRGLSHDEDLPDFVPSPTQKQLEEEVEEAKKEERTREEDYGSSEHGPDLNGTHKESEINGTNETDCTKRRDQSTQTEKEYTLTAMVTKDKNVGTREVLIEANLTTPNCTNTTEDNNEKSEEVKEENSSWWRYLYPFYYFV